MSDTVDILGVNVSVATPDDTVQCIIHWCQDGPAAAKRGCYVCATSVHGLVEAVRDPSFRDTLNAATRVTADGMPLVWFGRLRGHRAMERGYGPDLMKQVCARSVGSGVRHFLYGGAPGVADALSHHLEQAYPGIRVVGTHSPPFRPLTPSELDEVVVLIESSNANLVWVGLSTPKQERWIATVHTRLPRVVFVSVGAAFDFLTGRVRQAPPWVQRAGLEWAFRLSQEPRRLWRRYAFNNPVFIVLATLQLLGLKRYVSDSGRVDHA